MKKISAWGKTNPWKARMLIVLFHLVLWITAWVTGKQLIILGASIPLLVWFIVLLIYFSSILFYPFRNQKKQMGASRFYFRQKTADSCLAISLWGMVLFLANRSDAFFTEPAASAARLATIPVPLSDSIQRKTYKEPIVFAASMRDENGKKLPRAERRKLLKEQIRGIRADRNISEGERAALITLSVILAGLAIIGVAALACNLSCNGSDAAALVVGIGGTALIIFLLVHAIRGINRKAGHVRKRPPPPPVQ